MKKLFFILFLCSHILYAENLQPKDEQPIQYAEIIQTDDDLFRTLHFLHLQDTKVSLLDHEPSTRAEVALYLNSINIENLDAKSTALYNRVYEYVHKKDYLLKSENLNFDTNAQFALQAQYSESSKNLFQDNISHYHKMPALIAVPLSINISKYVNLGANIELKKGFWASLESIPYTNIPLKDDAIDVHIPHMANLSFANNFMSFTVGRSRHKIGQTLHGSLFLADATNGLDYFSLRFFHKNFNFGSSIYIMERDRFLFTHEINFNITKYVGIRLYEGTTLYGKFDLRYLNPMMIFHNLFGWDESNINGLVPNGSQFGLGIEATPYKGLRFYGQFEMNQFQTSYERKHYPGASKSIPNSLGGLVGVEYAHSFNVGTLTFQNEFLYANPWLNILENTKISFIDNYFEKTAPLAPINRTQSNIVTWLTNPLGPDTIAFTTKLSFEDFFKYALSLQYRFLVKGENEKGFLKAVHEGKNVYYPSSNPDLAHIKTPSGNPLYVHTISLEGFYEIYKNLKLQTSLQLSFFHGREQKIAFIASTSLNYKIR